MCRSRPGPRCSNTAQHRYNKASENFERVKAQYDSALERAGGDRERVPRRIRAKQSLASLRLNAAHQVYWATPAGQKFLKEEIETQREALDAFGEETFQPSDTSDRARLHRSIRAKLTRASNRLAEGIERRTNSYADMHLVKSERRTLRTQATARGGNISRNAQPLSAPSAAELRSRLDAEGITLREWDENDVSRASSWVDRGVTGNTYKKNPRLRAFERGRDVDGRIITLGSKVEGEEPVSRLIRLNLPDGQVVEGRHDFHLTKNEDGKYVVSARSTVASSWEDASPIDNTKQQAGHLLSSGSRAGRAEAKMIIGTATSKTEAKRILAAAKREFDPARVTALMGRDILVSRAERRSTALQTRGFAIWQRYASDKYDAPAS